MTWLVVMVGLLLANLAAAEAEKAPHEQYRVLEWAALVPPGWEPPVVSPAYDDVKAQAVDAEALVQALDQQLVALPGYMKPIKFSGNEVTEFLLVPFLPHHTVNHAHLDPNQKVYVHALEPIVVENPFAPIWVVGTLSLETVMTDEGPAGYRISEAVSTAYEP